VLDADADRANLELRLISLSIKDHALDRPDGLKIQQEIGREVRSAWAQVAERDLALVDLAAVAAKAAVDGSVRALSRRCLR
jgi:hypothetical protein